MTTALEQFLAAIEDEIGDAKTKVGNSSGPLSDPEKTTVKGDLDAAQSDIASALNEINNAGSADTTDLPSTLPAIANECLILARDAHTESMRTSPSNTTIGNKIKTVDRIIDVANGYRARAGTP